MTPSIPDARGYSRISGHADPLGKHRGELTCFTEVGRIGVTAFARSFLPLLENKSLCPRDEFWSRCEGLCDDLVDLHADIYLYALHNVSGHAASGIELNTQLPLVAVAETEFPRNHNDRFLWWQPRPTGMADRHITITATIV